MIDMIFNSLRILFRKRTRTLLTLLGITVGVASVLIINNISRCGSTALSSEIDELGMGGLSVMLKNQSAPLAEEELEAIRSLSYVDYAMPLMFESTDAYIHQERNPVYLWGIDKSAKDMINLTLINGRFINSSDISSYSKCCLIDKKLAEDCYGSDNVTGKKLVINSGGTSSEYNIIGVVKTGGGILENMMGSLVPTFLYVPYTTLQASLNTGNFSQIAVKIKPDHDNDLAGENIIKTIERETDEKGAYMVTNLSKQKENLDNIIGIFTIVLTSVGIVSLFVAGLSIMNVMLASVTERTREIGIKKALGASKTMIVTEFLCEALVLTLIGAVAGIIVGTAISFTGAGMIGLTLVPGVDIIFITVMFSLIVGIIFGIYPALKAARLRPVEALRSY
ncbi:MAG: ABC transporter permease [Clostridia bacterium]|nr:ABC transporter permease [Clostridia bacterium]